MTANQSGGASAVYADQLCAAVCVNWFPANPSVHAKIRNRFRRNEYHDTSALALDLVNDPSLFVYCLRELAQVGGTTGLEPVEAIQHANLDRLRRLLDVEDFVISIHAMQGAEQFRIAQLARSMTGAAVARALAPSEGVPPELAQGCEVFRQLGLTLMSWNYPHVFQRALQAAAGGDSLESILGRLLGATPMMFGISLARQWQLSPVVLSSLGVPVAELDQQTEETVTKIRSLCEVGEALARAAEPEVFPSAGYDWTVAKHYIESRLGRPGMQRLLEEIDVSCGSLRQYCPELMPLQGIETKVSVHVRREYGEHRLKRNDHLSGCPKFLRDQLEEIYSRLDGTSVSSAQVQSIVTRCIASVGFTTGCVYVLEPERRVLAPRILIGAASRSSYAFPALSLDRRDHQVVRTFYAASILIDTGAVVAYSGALGSLSRMGVLYLEIPHETADARGECLTACYCAINQALADCLILV